MNTTPNRSRLTHARLQLEFTGGRRRSPATISEAQEATEVFFKSLSDVVAAGAAAGSLVDVAEGDERVKAYKTRLADALDADVEASLGRAVHGAKTRSPIIRTLKALRQKTAPPRNVFISHVLDATLDPRTWRTITESVGPRPTVSVLLYVPESLAGTRSPDLLSDLDVALVYVGSPPAAEGIEDLARVMTPDVPVPEPAVVLQARRNAEARTALLTEFGGLTAAQVAELSGSEAHNRSALAGRWRREGRLLAVDHHGTTYYPGFQFDADGQPRPVVAEVLEHLNALAVTPWQQALWFTTANGWLDGRRPVDILEDEPAAIVGAAREAVREPVG
jgi:hypothetical protein